MSLRAIHDFELALTAPFLAMEKRGIKVDEERRQAMLADLDNAVKPLQAQLQDLVVPLLTETTPRRGLFRERWTCPCCRNGKAKRQACWSCAGFEKKPTKKMLREGKVLDSHGLVLGQTPFVLAPCLLCNGEGQRLTDTFNPESDPQKQIVLYDLLKLPRMVDKGKLKVDEDTLKIKLLPYDKSGVVALLLKATKINTIRSVFKRIEPAEDGRIRCFFNPAGTETGRLSGAGSFLLPSTNLLNVVKTEAAKDARFAVRRCFVASEGMKLVEADLSGAEAWIVAALSDDEALLERLRTPSFKLHRWTASQIFGMPEDEVDEIQYFLGKKARHGGNYGLRWATHQTVVNAQADITGISITASEAKAQLEGIHRLHPGLAVWWRRAAAKLAQDGSLTSIFGFRRTFYGRRASSPSDHWLDEVHREAIAHEPQHTVAYLALRGLLRWWDDCEGRLGNLLLTVYDSILLESTMPVDAATILRGCMLEEITINGHTLTIPVETKIGDDWGSL